MTFSCWQDTSRSEAEKQWVAEIFRRDSDEEPMHVLCWYATEGEAEEAADQFIYEYLRDED